MHVRMQDVLDADNVEINNPVYLANAADTDVEEEHIPPGMHDPNNVSLLPRNTGIYSINLAQHLPVARNFELWSDFPFWLEIFKN